MGHDLLIKGGLDIDGTGQAASAAMAADAFQVILWIPPQQNQANRP